MRRVDDPRLYKVEAFSKSLVYHGYLLTSISGLDAGFQRWLDEALRRRRGLPGQAS